MFDFKTVPLNTDMTFIKGVDKSGCSIYVPILKRDNEAYGSFMKKKLQQFLDGQVEPILYITKP